MADIHGNYPALSAVAEEVQGSEIDRVFVLGDIVGYYYWPQQVIALLRKWDAEAIAGNHERMLRQLIGGELQDDEVKKTYGDGLRRVIAETDEAGRAWLSGLADTITVETGGRTFLLCHGSPVRLDDYIYPDTDEAVLGELLASVKDFLLLGHTHYPFIYRQQNKTLVNPGSVGQARNKGGVACWAVIDLQQETVALRETPYDYRAVMEMARRVDPHRPYMWEVLARNAAK